MRLTLTTQLRRLAAGYDAGDACLDQQISEAVTSSKRLGLDYRQIAAEASALTMEIDRCRDALAALRRTECFRFISILIFALAVRYYLNHESPFLIVELPRVIGSVLIALVPLCLFCHEFESIELGVAPSCGDLVASFLVLGNGRQTTGKMAARLKSIRKQELLSGIDANRERKLLFMGQLSDHIVILESTAKRLKAVAPLYELGLACCEFMFLDAGSLLSMLENGVNF